MGRTRRNRRSAKFFHGAVRPLKDEEMVSTGKRPLKVGLVLPQLERGLDGATASWADLRAIAERAEAAGFDSLWVVDHLLIRWARVAAQHGAPIPPGLAGAEP